jgi:hypothetical protein
LRSLGEFVVYEMARSKPAWSLAQLHAADANGTPVAKTRKPLSRPVRAS